MSDFTQDPERHLEGLDLRFLRALELRRAGDAPGAAEVLREVLRIEPRLPEPHLELAHIHLETDELAEAELHAREAARLLDAGGQWNQDIPSEVMRGLAWSTLGEALRRRADDDLALMGNPETWRALVAEAASCFQRAAMLDPNDRQSAILAAELQRSITDVST